MKRWFASSAIALALAFALLAAFASPAHAASTGNKGQPSQSCQAQTSSPPGFNTAGFTHATTVYAGAQPQNSNNPKSVAQYDVACFQLSH
ncbi:MAG TPA: hypothetical protein VF792_11700 [Ktedonobacterales bacterium]